MATSLFGRDDLHFWCMVWTTISFHFTFENETPPSNLTSGRYKSVCYHNSNFLFARSWSHVLKKKILQTVSAYHIMLWNANFETDGGQQFIWLLSPHAPVLEIKLAFASKNENKRTHACNKCLGTFSRKRNVFGYLFLRETSWKFCILYHVEK